MYLQLEEVFESTNGGATWNTVGPYWNFDITCDPDDDDPYNCPPTTHPDQHAGMILTTASSGPATTAASGAAR